MKKKMLRRGQGQTAIEYMLLLSITVIVLIYGFQSFLPRLFGVSETYYNVVSNGLMGNPASVNFLDDNIN